MAPAGRVPAADGQVAGQVLVPDGLVADGRHFGLTSRKRKKKKRKSQAKRFSRDTWASAGTDLQPDVLGGGGDGRDLEAGVAVLGDQLAGVDVVLGRQLGLDANPDAVRRAPVRVGYLNLRGEGGGEAFGGRQLEKQASGSSSHVGQRGLTFPL